MPFTEVSLVNFRNIASQKLPVHYEQVFFVGPNGQGKTNFLEALYLLAYGRSFRSQRDDVMLRHGCDEMSVRGRWRDPGAGIDAEISVRYRDRKKDIRINDSPIRDRKELAEQVPCIVFSHDDIEFVKGAPENQRWFFNQCLSTYRISFIEVLRSYGKIVRTRNQVIRDRQLDMLPLYDAQMAASGIEIAEARAELVADFNELFTPLFAAVSGLDEELSIEYRPSWKDGGTEAVVRYLAEHRDRDLVMNTSTSGPHRDRFLFRLAGRDFLKEASTGQLRLMGLVLRAAQARLFARMAGKAPVLLLDDVLLELDAPKRRKFMEELPRYQQAFFTFLPDENISIYSGDNAVLYRVKNGEYESTGVS
jgi:DNA replication and repair protein RecF